MVDMVDMMHTVDVVGRVEEVVHESRERGGEQNLYRNSRDGSLIFYLLKQCINEDHFIHADVTIYPSVIKLLNNKSLHETALFRDNGHSYSISLPVGRHLLGECLGQWCDVNPISKQSQ